MTKLASLSGDHTKPGITHLGALCKAAGDELRLQILRVLQRDAFGVLELAQIFAIRQPAMSHHLKVLAKAGLVVTRKEGTFIFYRRNINDGSELALLREQIFTQLDTCPLPAVVLEHVTQIHESRAATSKAFFGLNAEGFRQQQDLIASYSLYGNAVLELLEPERQRGAATILEIGLGEGELLQVLAPRFAQVIALDNSAAMLKHAKAQVGIEASKNIDYILGETGSHATAHLRADCVTLNMVLHHVAIPANMLKDIYQLLNPGGCLIVTELCQHDQDWVRDTCGDLWLGFHPEELGTWAQESGFKEGESVYMAQCNGFRVQLRKFHK